MDDSGKIYDKEEPNKAASSDSLKNSENSFYHGGNKSNKLLDKGGLYKAESKKSGGLAGKGLSAVANKTPVGKVISLMGKNKTASAGIMGGLTSIILIFAFLFGMFVTHEINIIQQDLVNYEDKAVSLVVHEATKQIFKRVFCNKLSGVSMIAARCTRYKASESSDSQNNPMEEDAAAIDLTDPLLETGLAKQGIQENTDPTDPSQITGFTEANTGQPITASDLSNPATFDQFQAGIPDFSVAQINTLEPLAATDAGASFAGLPTDTSNVDAAVEEDVLGTDTSSVATSDTATTGAEAPSQNANQIASESGTTPQSAAADLATADAGVGHLSGIFQTVGDVIQSANRSVTLWKGLGDAELAQNLGKSTLINTIIVDFCTIKNAVQKGVSTKIPSTMGLLIRQSSSLMSIGDQMKVPGKLNGKQISQYTNLYNGNPAATAAIQANPKLANDPNVQNATLPFDRSAAWFSMTGQSSSPSTNPGIPISQSSLPTLTGPQMILAKMNSGLNTLGIGLVCSVDSGLFGNIISGGLFIAQVIAGGLTLGTSQLAIGSAIGGAQFFIYDYLDPLIAKYFTPIAMDGLESSVQLLNNSDAGANLMFNIFSQRLGGKPLTSTQAVSLNASAIKSQQIAQSHLSFYNRTFAVSNPSSLISKVMLLMPITKIGLASSIVNDITHAPLLIIRTFGDILSGAKVYALSPSDPGSAYGFTQYGFTPGQATKYDPFNNEQFLFHTSITYNKRTKTLISLLGDPNKYPNAANDPNKEQILHCFTRSFLNPSNETSVSSSNICGSMGNFNYNQVSPQPIGITQVAISFCEEFQAKHPNKCQVKIASMPVLNNIMVRYRQYLLDDQVMGYLKSLYG